MQKKIAAKLKICYVEELGIFQKRYRCSDNNPILKFGINPDGETELW